MKIFVVLFEDRCRYREVKLVTPNEHGAEQFVSRFDNRHDDNSLWSKFDEAVIQCWEDGNKLWEKSFVADLSAPFQLNFDSYME